MIGDKKIKKIEIIILVALYLVLLSFWTLTFRMNPIPYGEPDAAIHFRLADEMYLSDKPLVEVPKANPLLGFDVDEEAGHFTIAPQHHTNIALMEIIGGERIIPFFLYIAIACSLIFFTVFFLLRKLYGPLPAFLASIFIIFSMRERLTYLWGQWATSIGILFIPMILWCYYRYTNSFIDKNEKKVHLFMFFILFAIQFLIHPAVFFLCVAMVIAYTIMLIIKERKFPFSIKYGIIGFILFFIIIFAFAPLQTPQYLNRMLNAVGLGEKTSFGTDTVLKEDYDISRFERIFKWYDFPQSISGNYPEFIFSYKDIYYGYWTLPFLFIGIGVLLLKRRRKDLLILSMIVGFYGIMHTDVIGSYLDPKVIRLFYAEAAIFYPVIAIGITSITSFISLEKRHEQITKYCIMACAILMIILTGAKTTYEHFNGAYPGIMRLNQAEFDAAVWINENLPEDAAVMYAGIPTFPLRAWFQSVTGRLGIFDVESVIPIKDINLNMTDHIVVDYSWYVMMNNEEALKQLKAWQEQNFNITPIYNNNNLIEVYQVG